MFQQKNAMFIFRRFLYFLLLLLQTHFYSLRIFLSFSLVKKSLVKFDSFFLYKVLIPILPIATTSKQRPILSGAKLGGRYTPVWLYN